MRRKYLMNIWSQTQRTFDLCSRPWRTRFCNWIWRSTTWFSATVELLHCCTDLCYWCLLPSSSHSRTPPPPPHTPPLTTLALAAPDLSLNACIAALSLHCFSYSHTLLLSFIHVLFAALLRLCIRLIQLRFIFAFLFLYPLFSEFLSSHRCCKTALKILFRYIKHFTMIKVWKYNLFLINWIFFFYRTKAIPIKFRKILLVLKLFSFYLVYPLPSRIYIIVSSKSYWSFSASADREPCYCCCSVQRLFRHCSFIDMVCDALCISNLHPFLLCKISLERYL